MTTTTTFEKILATVLYLGYIAMAAAVYIFLVPKFMTAGNTNATLIGVGLAAVTTILLFGMGTVLWKFLNKPTQALD